MRETMIIMRRELKAYFFSPIAYVFGVLYLGVVCWMGSGVIGTQRADMTDWFGWQPVVFLFFLPALSMRLWAEERKSGTLELLLTFPVTIPQLICGKFLASIAYLGLLLVMTFLLPLTLGLHGALDWFPTCMTYVALLLMAASYIAVGMFWSAITRDQIIAFLLSMVMLAMLYGASFLASGVLSWLPDSWSDAIGGEVMAFVNALSPRHYFSSVARGIVDTGDLVYYVCFCAFFLHANALILHGKRIKG